MAAQGHLPRLLNEQFGQVLVAGVGFLDRLVLMGLLQRAWGNGAFAHWNTLLAFAGFGSLFEFGFNLYYNNRITFETERGQHERARLTLAEANTVFLICAVAGAIILPVLAWSTGAAGAGDGRGGLVAVILMTSASCLRLTTIGIAGQYRANRAYSRFAYITAASETLRIAATAAAVLSGADLHTTAAAALVMQLITPIGLLFVDSARRFAPHQIEFRWPRGESLRQAMAMSGAYFMQMLPVVMWTSAPGVLLERFGLAAPLLASFFLVRTLANLARTPLQMFGIVIGQECGRRIAVGDGQGALAALAGGSRLFAVLSGIACGAVICAGAQMLRLQTGDPRLFSTPLALAAMAPMLLGAVSVLVHNVLVASNAPYLAMVARWAQVFVTLVAWLAGGGFDPALRMMAALAAGEVAGYMPVAYFATARLIRGASARFFLGYTLLTLVSTALAGALFGGGLRLFGDQSVVRVLLALGTAGAACAGLVLALGIDAATRRRIIDSILTAMHRPSP